MEAVVLFTKAVMYAVCTALILSRALVNAALFTIRDLRQSSDGRASAEREQSRVDLAHAQSWCVSLPGAGFMLPYELGAASALLECGLARVTHAAGASSGCLAAALLVLAPHRIAEASSVVCSYAAQGHGVTAGHKLIPKLREVLERFLPADSHTLASGHLFVSVTRLRDGKNLIISDFSTRQELIQVLLASCVFPFYSGIAGISCRGEIYCDGGLTDNQPLPGSLVSMGLISVSPFEGTQAICPRGICPRGQRMLKFAGLNFKLGLGNLQRLWQAVVPPAREKLELYYGDGYRDAVEFVERIKSC